MATWAKGAAESMTASFFPQSLRTYRLGPPAQLLLALGFALVFALAMIGHQRLLAQIEGERGIAAVAGSSDIESGLVEVNTTGKNAEEARAEGWKQAQRKAWEQLKGPSMGDSQIASMVSSVVIDREQIGPRRYIASLAVIFDRAKAGQYLGSGNASRSHSAPMLVIPVLYSGGTGQVFEVRGIWQRAWAGFRAGSSSIDYVRPSGAGGDSLILTAGQPGRHSRTWWRNVLDQFNASDVVIPVARLERQWPGGPVKGTFTARYGPNNSFLESFSLTAENEAGVPAMLNTALVRMDQSYSSALSRGLLSPDPTLQAEQRALDAALAAIRASAEVPSENRSASPTSDETTAEPGQTPTDTPTTAPPVTGTYTVQFATADAAALDSALGSVRGVSGVKGASISSTAIGGTSVMRVTFSGDLDALAAALRGRGWQVSVGAGALSIRR